jgi:hypothetical protein
LKQHEKKVSRKGAKDFLWELICGPEALFPSDGFLGLDDGSVSGSAHNFLESFAPSPLRLCAFA